MGRSGNGEPGENVPVLRNGQVAPRVEDLLGFVGLANRLAAGAALLLLEFAAHDFCEIRVRVEGLRSGLRDWEMWER